MSQYLTIARPYATALFEQAKGDQGLYEAWSSVLQTLREIIQQPVVSSVINHPKTTVTEQHSILSELVKAVSPAETNTLANEFTRFLALLLEHRRLTAVSDMFTLFKKLVEEAQGVLEVKFISALGVDTLEQEKINAKLAKRFKTNVRVQFEVDKNLIGGAIIRTDKFVIDGSLKGKLTSLQQSLNSVKG